MLFGDPVHEAADNGSQTCERCGRLLEHPDFRPGAFFQEVREERRPGVETTYLREISSEEMATGSYRFCDESESPELQEEIGGEG